MRIDGDRCPRSVLHVWGVQQCSGAIERAGVGSEEAGSSEEESMQQWNALQRRAGSKHDMRM